MLFITRTRKLLLRWGRGFCCGNILVSGPPTLAGWWGGPAAELADGGGLGLGLNLQRRDQGLLNTSTAYLL